MVNIETEMAIIENELESIGVDNPSFQSEFDGDIKTQ